MERKPRAIRLNEQEWTDFKGLLGTIWLRKQIARARAKDQRKPTATNTEE